MAVFDFLFDIFEPVEIQPTALDIAEQQFRLDAMALTLEGLRRQGADTNALDEAVISNLGFKREGGELVRLSEDEQMAVFSPLQQMNFKFLRKQGERLERAFAGDLPVSEALKQSGEERFKILQESLARRGNVIEGTDFDTGVGFSTPGIQSLASDRRIQKLREDEERRNELNRGLFNFREGTGLLSRLGTTDFDKFTQAPKRFNLGEGAGLLSGLSKQATFKAEQQRDLNKEFGDLLTFGAGKLVDLFTP